MFEECPADFSFLRMEETPPTGGDTVWCSGYELYVIYVADYFFDFSIPQTHSELFP
jgi:hypothetical protein